MTRILSPWLLCVLAGAAAAQETGIPAGPEVKTTASGLRYSVLKPGDPKGPHPKLGDTVKVHYTGWLANGTVFDSSVKRGTPAEFKLGRVIEGWNEGLKLMTPGAKFKFTIPPALAYGKRGAPPKIGPDATLVFEVELLEVKPGPALPVFHPAHPKAQKTTPSGLKYEVLEEGKGQAPTADEVFELKYALWTTRGKLLDCTELAGHTVKGSTRSVGLEFLKEAPLLMKPGARYRLEVPPKLCFKDQARGPLPPNTVTVWELELLRVLRPLPVPAFAPSPPDKVTTTKSGLQYEVLRKGQGKSPELGQAVTVHYAGWLVNGKLFDSSFARGEPATFQLGRVIPGWNEGLQLMREGAVYKFTIPPALAYGKSGAGPDIGPDQTLIFHVELIKVGK